MARPEPSTQSGHNLQEKEAPETDLELAAHLLELNSFLPFYRRLECRTPRRCLSHAKNSRPHTILCVVYVCCCLFCVMEDCQPSTCSALELVVVFSLAGE